MKPYGYETMHWDAKNRMGGDLMGTSPVSASASAHFSAPLRRKPADLTKPLAVILPLDVL